jgi:hypothetical protein
LTLLEKKTLKLEGCLTYYKHHNTRCFVMMFVSTQTLFVVHGTCNAPKHHCHLLISYMTYYTNTSCKTIKFNLLLGKVHIFVAKWSCGSLHQTKLLNIVPFQFFVSVTFNRIVTKICKVELL